MLLYYAFMRDSFVRVARAFTLTVARLNFALSRMEHEERDISTMGK